MPKKKKTNKSKKAKKIKKVKISKSIKSKSITRLNAPIATTMTENPILAREEFLGSNIERPVPKSPIKKPMTYIKNIAIMEEKIANLKFSEGFIILDL